jgi:antitoxin (DNA-binding transcriptional repressor) of toxin-antitoxin stability system
LTVEQAQHRLEEVLHEVAQGEEMVLVLKTGERLRVSAESRRSALPPRVPGALAGQLTVGPEFFDELPEEELRGM